MGELTFHLVSATDAGERARGVDSVTCRWDGSLLVVHTWESKQLLLYPFWKV